MAPKQQSLGGYRNPKTFISRAMALQQAKRHVIERLFKGATIRDGLKAKINAYGVRHEDTWVVYLKERGFSLRPSQVIVVCKCTGRVLHAGSTEDEG